MTGILSLRSLCRCNCSCRFTRPSSQTVRPSVTPFSLSLTVTFFPCYILLSTADACAYAILFSGIVYLSNQAPALRMSPVQPILLWDAPSSGMILPWKPLSGVVPSSTNSGLALLNQEDVAGRCYSRWLVARPSDAPSLRCHLTAISPETRRKNCPPRPIPHLKLWNHIAKPLSPRVVCYTAMDNWKNFLFQSKYDCCSLP